MKSCICWVPGHLGEICPTHRFTDAQLREIARRWRTSTESPGRKAPGMDGLRPATYTELEQRGLTGLTYDEAMVRVRHGATATRPGSDMRVEYREIGDGGAPVWGPALMSEHGWTPYKPPSADREANDWMLTGYTPTA